MASTENSGMQGFQTGAIRSADDHKIDFEGHLSPEALHYFGEYMHQHRVQRDGQVRASDNWTEGIPVHKYMKSLMRHTFDLWRAWRGTVTFNPDNHQPQTLGELSSAILFNVQGLLHELIGVKMTSWTSVPKDVRKQIEAGTYYVMDIPKIPKVELSSQYLEELKKLRQVKPLPTVPNPWNMNEDLILSNPSSRDHGEQ